MVPIDDYKIINHRENKPYSQLSKHPNRKLGVGFVDLLVFDLSDLPYDGSESEHVQWDGNIEDVIVNLDEGGESVTHIYL